MLHSGARSAADAGCIKWSEESYGIIVAQALHKLLDTIGVQLNYCQQRNDSL